MSINVVKDVELLPNIPKYDVVLIGTNILCTLGNGIQREVALNYPYADKKNLRTKYGDKSKLGTVLSCEEENNPTICLLFIVKSFSNKSCTDFLNYEALEKCLKLVNALYKGKKVVCPMLGCSRWDGNGNKDKVMEIITHTATDIDLTIYDYFQKSRDEKMVEMLKAETALIEASGYSVYHEAVKKRKAEAELIFKKNGRARY